MSGRIFVLIFFFWAILTIVTPTLILLSESSKAYLDSDVAKSGGGARARRMIGYTEKEKRLENVSAPAEAPTPAPAARQPVNGTGEVIRILRKILKKQ